MGRDTQPSNGIVVRGVRALVTDEDRDWSASEIAVNAVDTMLLGSSPGRRWWVLQVSDAVTAEELAVRRFASHRLANKTREKFIAAVAAMSDQDHATANWTTVLTNV